MRRGDVVAIVGRDGDGGSRPAVVVQSDAYPGTASFTVCPLTTHAADAPLLRLQVQASAELPLSTTAWVMVEKIATVSRDRVATVVGRLSRDEQMRLDRLLAVFLGLG